MSWKALLAVLTVVTLTARDECSNTHTAHITHVRCTVAGEVVFDGRATRIQTSPTMTIVELPSDEFPRPVRTFSGSNVVCEGR